jgi:hypothetical protein
MCLMGVAEITPNQAQMHRRVVLLLAALAVREVTGRTRAPSFGY